MTRLQEVEKLLDNNLRHDCPMCYIENKTLQFAEVKPNFYCGAGALREE